MFRSALLTLTFVAATTAAQAETIKVATTKSVADAADALVAAVEGAGAKVFARIDHGAGAQSIGEDIGGSQLVIFGNPKVGTPALMKSRETGLALPLKVLVYEDPEGAAWLAYEAPAGRLNDLAGSDLPAELSAPMAGALAKLTAKAAE